MVAGPEMSVKIKWNSTSLRHFITSKATLEPGKFTIGYLYDRDIYRATMLYGNHDGRIKVLLVHG